ncbi:MAG: DUF1176 domain-containing protein [Rhizobiales bacterium]|nr:DUF1176 domain-containing protein [Hyphomicrobiales bacterium]
MLKCVGNILSVAMPLICLLSTSAAFGKDNDLIAQALLSEADLPIVVRKIWGRSNEECMTFDGDLIKTFGGTEVAVSEVSKYNSSVRFYLLPCGSPAAYNATAIGIVYYPKGNLAKIASLPIIGNRGPTTQDVLLNASWDTKKQQLISYYKGRGLGDCGSSFVWEWEKNSFIAAFVLIEQKSKENCDGVDDEWPLVWPIK